MNYTKQYHLPQWAESDRILMDDFNQAMAGIETGLAEVRSGAETGRSELETKLDTAVESLTAAVGSGGKTARIAWGSYTGNGKYGAANPTALALDFKPVLVVVGSPVTAANMTWPSVMIRGSDSAHCDQSVSLLNVSWLDRGVSWYSTSDAANQNNGGSWPYFYVVIGYSE